MLFGDMWAHVRCRLQTPFSGSIVCSDVFFLPNGQPFFVVGLAAVIWVIYVEKIALLVLF
jgi:hypothetical protein